jgi:hypothetical protein
MHKRMEQRGGMQHEHRGPRDGAVQQPAPSTSEHTH